MNIFIKVINGQYIDTYNRYLFYQEYPELPDNFLREDNLELSDYNIFVCAVLPKPQHDSSNYDCKEKKPELSNGSWVRGWQLIEKSAEEKRQAKYNPSEFLKAIESNLNYETWASLCKPNKYAELISAVTRASIHHDWSYVQILYNKLKTKTPTTLYAAEWQAIADNYGIPIVF